nr:recombinase family protein [Pantoea sp. BAV 3049]
MGYARVSTTDQDLTHQIAVLTAADCHKISPEKMTGTKKEGRRRWMSALSTYGRRYVSRHPYRSSFTKPA